LSFWKAASLLRRHPLQPFFLTRANREPARFSIRSWDT